MVLKFSDPLIGIERCPQCNVAKPLLSERSNLSIRYGLTGLGIRWATYECSSCNRVTLAEGFLAKIDRYGGVTSEEGGDEIRVLYPSPVGVDDSLPPDSQRYLKQAMDTKFAPDASIMMAGSAVDAMLKAKGYKDGSLYSRIDQAVKDHVLTEGMAQWAHKVRLEANAVRHADEEARPPNQDDATKVVEFAKALGDFLYVFTARVEEGIQEAASSVPEAVS